jgi:hypothetical protein
LRCGPDDVTLATGSMASATLAFNPATGVRNAHFIETFAIAPGESGFFGTPPLDGSASLDIRLTTNPDTFTLVPGGDFINGAFGTAQLVPEPASIAVLGAGLLGVIPLRRRLQR